MTYFDKLHIIVQKLRSLKFSIRTIADIVQVGKSTVHRWLHQVVKPLKSKYSKFTKIINTAITTCLNNPFKPLKYIVNLVSKTQKISKTSLWRILRSNKMVYKKVSLVGGNPENVTLRRREFSEIVKNKDPNEIICLDETSYYEKPIMKYGWTEKGKKIFSPMIKDCNRRKTLTLAVSCDGIVYYESFQGSQNSNLFRNFITNLVESLPKNRFKYLLMDNVAFHKTKEVKELLEINNITPLYTSPYSPEWNPTEFVFSRLKQNWRRGQSMFECINSIKTDREYFTKLYNYVFTRIKKNMYA